MMARRNRLAFTLVELLVVIVIIAMLVGMLVPAVQRSRENGRRAQCMNNQHEISLAMAQYESSVGRFPGYINKMGTGAIVTSPATSRQMPLSWVTVLLPHLGREDMWREWRTQTVGSGSVSAALAVRLPQVVCPSDIAKRDNAASLSYVVNCGIEDGTNDLAGNAESAADGVFFNLYGYVPSGTTAWTPLRSPTVMTSNIRDGASHTLMLSENIQARTWHADPSLTAITMDEPYLGFVWRWTNSSKAAGRTKQINVDKDDVPATTLPDYYNYARPSSHHPTSVVVSYCDGHQQILSQAIQYDTLQHLMTPNSTSAGLGTFASDPELTD